MNSQTINQAKFFELGKTGDVKRAVIRGQLGGWTVEITTNDNTTLQLAAKIGHVRIFRRMEKLVTQLQQANITSFEVIVDQSTDTSRPPRPDAADRLKRAHQAAAEYDAWQIEQVQDAINDSRPNVEHADVMQRARARIRATAERSKNAA